MTLPAFAWLPERLRTVLVRGIEFSLQPADADYGQKGGIIAVPIWWVPADPVTRVPHLEEWSLGECVSATWRTTWFGAGTLFANLITH